MWVSLVVPQGWGWAASKLSGAAEGSHPQHLPPECLKWTWKSISEHALALHIAACITPYNPQETLPPCCHPPPPSPKTTPTEAGEGEDGRMKSAIGIGALLMDGLGDTIRVSLTEDPEYEMDPCRRLAGLGHTAAAEV